MKDVLNNTILKCVFFTNALFSSNCEKELPANVLDQRVFSKSRSGRCKEISQF